MIKSEELGKRIRRLREDRKFSQAELAKVIGTSHYCPNVNQTISVGYANFEDKNRIELIEIYYKSSKELEDRSRIKELYL